MKILFTGATSLAGRRFFSHLHAAGHEVLGLSRSPPPGDARYCAVDLETGPLPEGNFDALVHFASYVPLNERQSEWDECYRKNVLSLIRLLQWASGNVRRILLASSCAIYGSSLLRSEVDESHPLRPDTAYALSKYAQEQLVQAFCRSQQIPCAITRLGYVYGPDMVAARAALMFCKRILAGEPITLVNPRATPLNLIHQDDIASFGDLLLREGEGVYNLGCSRPVTVLDYVETAMRVSGKRVELIVREEGTSGACFNLNRRLRERHEAPPPVTLESGIHSIFESLS